MTLKEIMQDANQIAVEKGFWDGPVRTMGDQIALMHSELSDALEDFRDHGYDPSSFLFTTMESDHNDRPVSYWIEHGKKPEGIASEFADVIIRIADTCAHYGIPLEKAIELKMAYNRTRPIKHGGKLI